MRKIFIDPGALSPELSATSHETRPTKLLPTLQELLFFYQLLQTGDRGDKSDSNKYLRALTEGVMPDLLTYVG